MRGEISLAVLSLATVAAITLTPPAGTLGGLKRSLLPRTLQDKSDTDGRYEPRAADRRNVPRALAGKYKLTAAAGRYEPGEYKPMDVAGIYDLIAAAKRRAWAAVREYEPRAAVGRYERRAINNAARLAMLVTGNKQTYEAVAGKGTVFSGAGAEAEAGAGAGTGAGAGAGAGGPPPDSLNIVRQAVLQALGGAYIY